MHQRDGRHRERIGEVAIEAADIVRQLAYSLMNEVEIATFERELEMNFGRLVEGLGNYRVNIFKQRGTVALAKDAPKDVAEKSALALNEIVRALDGNTPKRVIVVPNRIVNVVV